MTTYTYEFTAFTEDALLSAGSGNGTNLGYGDSFTMPASADVTFAVTDNDPYLSGDSWNNENANDSSYQTATITIDGEEAGNGGQVYGEQYFWVWGSSGNWYLMIEIEQEGTGDDYFTFYNAYGVPEEGETLTVSCGGNISCWQPHMGCLEGPAASIPPVAVLDEITITEGDSIGDGDDDAQLNILANDFDTDGTISLTGVNGAEPGDVVTVTTDRGVVVDVTVDVNGNLFFDSASDFDSLRVGETDSFQLTYTITDDDGNNATSTVTVTIEGETTVDAVDDVITVLESEGAGDLETLDSGAASVLANDMIDGEAYEGLVVTVNGQTGNVGQWIDLDKGRVKLNADGTIDFDADGDFDALNDGESEAVELNYTISAVEAGPDEYQCLFFNHLATGEIITDQFASAGLTISSANAANPVMIFDSANPTGGDFDLATSNLGKVLILSEDGNSANPDDNAGGGTFIFDFERAADIDSITMLDTEEPAPQIRLYGEDGMLLNTITGPVTADGGQGVAQINTAGVFRMEIELQGSGALDNLIYELAPQTETVIDDTATAKIVVNGLLNPNLDPIAADNGFVFREGAEASVVGNVVTDLGGDLDLNDSDPDGDDADLTVKSVTVDGQIILAGQEFTMLSSELKQEVRITVASNGDVKFDGQGNFTSLARGQMDFISIDYTVQDLDGGEDSANLVVTVIGEDEPPEVEYNILFLVDASSGLADSGEHGLFQFSDPVDLNGDGRANTVLDAELSAVQQFVDQLGEIDGLGLDVEIGVQTIAPDSVPASADDQSRVLADASGKAIFTSGDDLTDAFQGAGLAAGGQPSTGSPAGLVTWGAALAGANDFFEFTTNPAGEGDVVNLVYILSGSEGGDLVTPIVPPLADEIAELQSDHNAVVDAIIFNDTAAENPFLTAILADTGGNEIALVEDQLDLDALLFTPLLENLEIV